MPRPDTGAAWALTACRPLAAAAPSSARRPGRTRPRRVQTRWSAWAAAAQRRSASPPCGSRCGTPGAGGAGAGCVERGADAQASRQASGAQVLPSQLSRQRAPRQALPRLLTQLLMCLSRNSLVSPPSSLQPGQGKEGGGGAGPFDMPSLPAGRTLGFPCTRHRRRCLATYQSSLPKTSLPGCLMCRPTILQLPAPQMSPRARHTASHPHPPTPTPHLRA